MCGNHDYKGDASAQVKYTKRSERWYMPKFYYSDVSGNSLCTSDVHMYMELLGVPVADPGFY